MPRKTKPASKVPPRDWRTGLGYPNHGDRTDLWAWEFLRRNPAYRANWQQFVELAHEVRGDYEKPYDNLSDDWEADPAAPYWVIGRARDDGDPRGYAFDPPRNENESEDEWRVRIHAKSNRSTKITPLERWLGMNWGLECIADPTREYLSVPFRWKLAPFGVYSPAPHRHNKEFNWVRVLNKIAKMLEPNPLPPDALLKTRELLAKIPAAWEERREQMTEENHPEKRGRFIVEFDLRTSIPEQLRHAGDWMEREQKWWQKSGGKVWGTSRKNKETPGYSTYLRVLDAIEDVGDADGTKLKQEIATTMIAGYQANATYDERKRHLDRAATWIKRAKQLRDGEYLQLVAMASKPTLSELERHRK